MAEIYGYFLANEVNATERDVTGPTEQVQIMCSVKDKNTYYLLTESEDITGKSQTEALMY